MRPKRNARRAGVVSSLLEQRIRGLRLSLAGFLVVLFCSPALAQPPSAVVTHDLKEKWLGLSRPLFATLSVEGPAPLQVELPEKLLAPETERDWQIRPVGPATVTRTGQSRETWEQKFRLTPYVAGKQQVQLATVKVNGHEIPVAGFAVEVRLESADKEQVDSRAAKPVTGIEEPPPPPIDTTMPLGLWLGVAVLLMSVVIALVLWRIRRRSPPVPPHEWAHAAFARLEQANVTGEVIIERVAAIVREFIDRRFGIPAPKLTTSELLASADTTGWPTEQTESLRQLLEVCDRAKFAKEVPDSKECQRLLTAGRVWVDHVSADAEHAHL